METDGAGALRGFVSVKIFGRHGEHDSIYIPVVALCPGIT
jgi:hypothetical protein